MLVKEQGPGQGWKGLRTVRQDEAGEARPAPNKVLLLALRSTRCFGLKKKKMLNHVNVIFQRTVCDHPHQSAQAYLLHVQNPGSHLLRLTR